MEHGDFQGSETIPYGTEIMEREYICQIDSFVKMLRIHNTKNELNVNLRVQLVLKYQYWLIDFNKCARVMQDVKIGKLCRQRGST